MYRSTENFGKVVSERFSSSEKSESGIIKNAAAKPRIIKTNTAEVIIFIVLFIFTSIKK